MKKILYFVLLVACVTLASCSKDEPGGTATQATAGTWYGTFDGADEQGNVIPGYEDVHGIGRLQVITFNTAENVPTKMFISDLGNFWGFQITVDVDPATMTFSTNGAWVPTSPTSSVKITNGRIIPNGGVQNNGSIADAIEFNVEFDEIELDDDDNPIHVIYPEAYGFKSYKYNGIRYSGLVEND